MNYISPKELAIRLIKSIIFAHMIESISLYELQEMVRGNLEDGFPEQLWVKAEIAQIQVRSNGHCYLELSQSVEGTLVAKAKAVIWKSRYGAIARAFREAVGAQAPNNSGLVPGITILALVQVNYSELYGFSLVINDIEPQYTLGEAELQKQKTIARLTEDGMMDAQQKLSLKALPYNLAVISAPDAAGLGDFRKHLKENEFGFVFNVTLFPATMQGAQAPESITDAIQTIETLEAPYDAILILRGGGSALDLACFDDYSLALAIASCSIPVFTAIGHERDMHVADMVAYDYVKTPTALADEFIDAFAAEDERISSFSTRLRLAFTSRLTQMEGQLDNLEQRIKAADPRQILSKGYTLITNEKGVVIKSAKDAKIGEKITILFEDGKVTAEVQ